MIGRRLMKTLSLLQHRQHGRSFNILGKSVAEFGEGVGGDVNGAHLLEDVAEMRCRWITSGFWIVFFFAIR